MFISLNSLSCILLFVFSFVEADFLAINWNVSTNSDNPHSEREYKYPLYQEVAPVPCDLTDSCDVFCPQDSDCNDSQKLSFQSLKSSGDCDGSLSPFYCGCDKFDKPEWQSVLCYVFKNPIYLGKFYKTPQKIEKYGTMKNLFDLERYLYHQNQYDEEIRPKVMNQYGSPIMTFVPIRENFPSVNPLVIKIPLKDSSFACKSSPVKYRTNHLSRCLTRISQELCINGHSLSVLPYLVQGSSLPFYPTMPVVLRDLDFLKGIHTEVSIKCLKLNLATKKFKKLFITYSQKTVSEPCEESLSTYRTVLVNNTCHNVLVHVQHEFILNGSEMVRLKAEYKLADIVLPLSSNDNLNESINHNYIYLKQKFDVSFFDIMVNSSVKNVSKNDELYNRGYFVGEELNFGFKSLKKSATTWEKGLLGVFRSENNCDNFSPISFGFDYFSNCHIRAKFPNCSLLRAIIEEKFEALLKGDSLAVYGNLRPPFSSTVPLLRMFENSTEAIIENSTSCSVPVTQDILIQYTSVTVPSGRIVHRILGVKADRSFKNMTVDGRDVALVSRVSFLYVPSFEGKPLSV